MEILLDTSQINILLIEIVERYLRVKPEAEYIGKTMFIKNTSQTVINKGTSIAMTADFSISREDLVKIYNIMYNPIINQNLEFNLFDYPIFTFCKEIKAWFNYKIFNRVPQEISVFDDCHYLFLKETIDTCSDLSSFKYIPDEEVNNIVKILNTVYKHYRNNGFTEVILSVIPNPVSVIFPSYKKYNDIIRRVQNHSGLVMPMLNIYDKLKSAPCKVYYNSDSHWNKNGFTIWLNEFNKYLSNVSKVKN